MSILNEYSGLKEFAKEIKKLKNCVCANNSRTIRYGSGAIDLVVNEVFLMTGNTTGTFPLAVNNSGKVITIENEVGGAHSFTAVLSGSDSISSGGGGSFVSDGINAWIKIS